MRPLGKIQASVLNALANNKDGKWHPGIGWIWDTPSGTLKVMRSLVPRGLVAAVEEEWGNHRNQKFMRTVYTITDEGRRIANGG